jgi:aspartate/methionine/tyrosine aminotransferase
VTSSLFGSGDIVIAQKPMYQSLYQIFVDRGITVIDWDLELNSLSWDLQDLEKLLRQYPSTKALVINNPNNPVGKCFSTIELKKISKLLDQKLLISDEVFLPIDLNDATSSIVDIHENSIAICDLSKSFALPGLRLGWIVSKNYNLLERFLAYKNYLSLRVSVLSEIIARTALQKSEILMRYNKNILNHNIYDNWRSGAYYATNSVVLWNDILFQTATASFVQASVKSPLNTNNIFHGVKILTSSYMMSCENSIFINVFNYSRKKISKLMVFKIILCNASC